MESADGVRIGVCVHAGRLGTGLAMMLNYRLLHISNAIFASTVTLLMPIVAVVWGVLDGESLTLLQSIGALIILAGLVFLRSKSNTQKR